MKKITSFIMLFALLGGAQAQNSTNPLLQKSQTPFGVPDFEKIKAAHYVPAIEQAIKIHNDEIDAIVNNPAKPDLKNTIEALDYSGELLNSINALFSNLTSAATSDSLQAIAKQISPILSKHSDDVSLNAKLFQRVKAVYDQKSSLNLDHDQTRLLDETYKDFIRAGAGLNADQQKKLRDINQQLSLLALMFGDNVLADNNAFKLIVDNKADLAGLPQSVVDAAAQTAKENKMEGKWIFTLNKPSMIPFLQYADKRELREKLYKGYLMRANNDNKNDNKKNIAKLVALRLEKANLLGYPSYAHYVLDRNMAKEPQKAFDLLNKVWDAALPVVKSEAADLQALINKEAKPFQLESWDWWYYAEKVRKEKYALDEEMLRPYFKLENVRDGIFWVSNKLYGITFSQLKDMPKYHNDVTVWEVKDAANNHLAVLYLDFFPRSSKRGGAWCTAYRKQYRKDGKNITPVISIVCNFSKPTDKTPALLNYDEVETFFHEFGHALHGMFSDGTYQRISGTAVPRDFVELPSQIMEHWASEPEVMRQYARHYLTNEVIPNELIEKINKSSHFNQGFSTTEFLSAAILDMNYHSYTGKDSIDANAFEKNVFSKLGLIPQIAPRYHSTYFNHIFSGGYSAGYYSYIWAEVLDADAFDAFKETGNIFDQKTAQSFRENVLAKGFSDEPMTLYLRFRGKEPSIDPLLRNRGLLAK